MSDDFYLRFKIWRGDKIFEVIDIRSYYAVGLKSGKTELDFLEPGGPGLCGPLLPHFGYSPCWYVRRKTLKRVNL
ncbi:MAG: hypothetical protein U0V70_17505 [Terriglobia bacterium]